MSNIRNTNENVEDIVHNGLVQERFENSQVLLKILEGVRFLSRQALHLDVTIMKAIPSNYYFIR